MTDFLPKVVMPNLFRHLTGSLTARQVATMQVCKHVAHLAFGVLKQVQHDKLFIFNKITLKQRIMGSLYKQGYVYIMTNQYRTTFYIGVTSNLEGRVWEHINNVGSLFVKKDKLYDLVYFEYCERITDAIAREKQLKIGIVTGRSI